MANYTWAVYYSDGTKFSQYNSDGSENLFKDIDETKLVNFVLSKDHQDVAQLNDFVLCVPSGLFILSGLPIDFGSFDTNRLIYFRRNRVSTSTSGETSQSTSHVLGVQATVNNKNRKIMFIIDDNTGQIGLLYD